MKLHSLVQFQQSCLDTECSITFFCTPLVITENDLRYNWPVALPIAVSSFTAIPKAPSPENPTTGTSGQPIFAPTTDGSP